MRGSATLKALWHMQAGECFYCGRPTWLRSRGESMRAAMARLECTSRRELLRREASREHLHRRADGGDNGMHNYVMACAGCNVTRHDKPALVHLADMRARAAL